MIRQAYDALNGYPRGSKQGSEQEAGAVDQSIINFLFGALFTLVGWLGKTLWSAVRDLQRDMKDIEVNLPKDYVGKDDYKADIREIKEMLKQLFELQREGKL